MKDSRKVGCLGKKTGTVLNGAGPKQGNYAVGGKAEGVVLSKAVGTQMMPSWAPDDDGELKPLVFAMLVWGFAFLPSFLLHPVVLLEM